MSNVVVVGDDRKAESMCAARRYRVRMGLSYVILITYYTRHQNAKLRSLVPL
jgi:hypothetical protein